MRLLFGMLESSCRISTTRDFADKRTCVRRLVKTAQSHPKQNGEENCPKKSSVCVIMLVLGPLESQKLFWKISNGRFFLTNHIHGTPHHQIFFFSCGRMSILLEGRFMTTDALKKEVLHYFERT